MKALFALTLIAIPVAAIAQTSAVSLEGKAFVARKVTLPDGKTDNKLFPVEQATVLPGEPVVFMWDYKNAGVQAATGFAINNPIPSAVQFTGVEQPWAVVSVDNGKSFGPLATRRIKAADGTMRAATAADVTNLRWAFAQPIAAGKGGRVSYYAIVK